ncbi:hypothetical protein MOJ79_17235 [Calidifontimicrobium sp. SYSU G02091]|uniref:hypothetical protein n=1 Tax=Calidifontimicrobium sp. SYSU G02091 TaxID=2926421 RepID=UPI001F52CAAD|nr:hypothetical protein [Calidifontimicrobium sp. SYSU G02091]MCI1193578.1 hypothetical protein [Calidifontimicrobium sp. SYSU G02091]
MPLPIEALEAALLQLPTSERARLLDRVVASLDADAARERAWDDLAARRDVEIDPSADVPGRDALDRLRTEIG